MNNTENRKEIFEKAKMNVIRFGSEDVIATSGGGTDPVVRTPQSLSVQLFMTHDAVNSGGTDDSYWN